MKLLVVSDVHIGRRLLNLKELSKDIEILYEQAADKAIELKVDYFVSCGDLFDSNRPTAREVEFVKEVNLKLAQNNVIPLAIAGDHSKHVSGVSWERVCGFNSFDKIDELIGIDYSDNPQEVLEKLRVELMFKTNATKLFLHGQVPELWKFCEEKKFLNISPILRAIPNKIDTIILGDVHRRLEMNLYVNNNPVYLGYCGSLGVTSKDEIYNKAYKIIDSDQVTHLAYDLPRLYKQISIKSKVEISGCKETLRQEIAAAGPARPVIIINYSADLARADLNEFNEFIHLGYIVRIERETKKKEIIGDDQFLQITSLEEDLSKRFSEVIESMPVLTSDDTKKLMLDIVSNVDDIRDILDKHKEKYNAIWN